MSVRRACGWQCLASSKERVITKVYAEDKGCKKGRKEQLEEKSYE